MTDQEIIKALRKCVCFGAGCDGCPFENSGAIDEDWCGDALVRAAADRLEELTASQHVMTMREDA